MMNVSTFKIIYDISPFLHIFSHTEQLLKLYGSSVYGSAYSWGLIYGISDLPILNKRQILYLINVCIPLSYLG